MLCKALQDRAISTSLLSPLSLLLARLIRCAPSRPRPALRRQSFSASAMSGLTGLPLTKKSKFLASFTGKSRSASLFIGAAGLPLLRGRLMRLILPAGRPCRPDSLSGCYGADFCRAPDRCAGLADDAARIHHMSLRAAMSRPRNPPGIIDGKAVKSLVEAQTLRGADCWATRRMGGAGALRGTGAGRGGAARPPAAAVAQSRHCDRLCRRRTASSALRG